MNSILPRSLVFLALGFAECVLSNPRQNASITAIGTVNLETGADCACSQLASSYPDQILFPDSADYTTQAINYWDVRADLRPACIFLPSSADKVSDAVGLFSKCGAQFAVRGGGHMNASTSFAWTFLQVTPADETYNSIPAQTILMEASCWPLTA